MMLWAAGLVPLGLGGWLAGSKEWTERRMGGWERGKGKVIKKKKLLSYNQ